METRKPLDGLKVAILCTDGVELVELQKPRQALDEAGATTSLISPKRDVVQGWNHDEKGEKLAVDLPLDEADSDDFGALLLPGGVQNPDQLRQNKTAVAFVRSFFDDDKPVAAICHAPWMLVEADVLDGERLTSWPSLQTDVRNAGGDWVDEPVVTSGDLVTSRKPDDIPAFNKTVIELFSRAQARV
ncbi:MAG TPA: type 1 glutamine amidotransferase domain-containing protein [Verrucomicrobiae bacterium]|nr:type 1 glutamine amidotransferase domain-containing protein [Verrucomicrobiae bacterium]